MPNSTTTMLIGSTTAMAAPRAAPDAVPSTYGSASGLRIRPWNVAPATASAAPTSIAVSTRGIRRSQTIVSVAGVQVRPRSSPKVRHRITPMLSAGPIRTDPSPTPTTSVSARATSTTPATMPGRPRSRPVRPTDRAALGIARTDTDPPDGAGGDLDVRPDRRGQRPEPGSEPGSRTRDLDVVDGPDHVVLDGGHHVPARSGGDGRRRRRVERVDPEDDHLRIALDQLLERDRVGVRVAGGDRVGAGQRHHLGQERRVRRREDLAGRVGVADLVEDARLGAGLGGLGRGGIGGELHVGAHARR